LNTDGNMTWGPDAQLTPLGISQAQNASSAWKTQSAAGAPLPESFYSSPLTRSSDTLNITWSSVPGVLIGNSKHAPVPVVLEGLRETIGVHTCDKRHSKTWIAQREPKWVFEKRFTEEDELWTADDRESDGAQQARIREALVQILDNDDSICEFF
jgi:broad specificity phosphatase PhoE